MTLKTPLQKVVEGGYCIGCGGCAAFDKRIRIQFDEMQRLRAVLPDDGSTAEASSACPFSDDSVNENLLASEVFDAPGLKEDARIGRHLATFGGWVVESDFRARASSGGLGTWIQHELLEQGLVDTVLNVTAVQVAPGESPLFRFTAAYTKEEVKKNAKTRYYPVEMSEVIAYIRDRPARYAVIGVPCFAKAIRLAARQDAIISDRLKFVLSIVCGHLKSAAFAESIAWQMGIQPNELTEIDFRTKLEGRPASRYGVTVSGFRVGKKIERTVAMEGLVGANWGHGLFKLKGCEFCDDVLGETADFVVGDAWLPAYDSDPKGANVVVVRNPILLDLVREARDEGRLHLEDLSADDVAASQAGGLRHRRDGLRYRLWLADKKRQWRPRKRFEARREHLDPHMQRIHRLRYELGQKSHSLYKQARECGDLSTFLGGIKPMVDRYEREMRPSFVKRVLNVTHRKIISVLRAN